MIDDKYLPVFKAVGAVIAIAGLWLAFHRSHADGPPRSVPVVQRSAASRSDNSQKHAKRHLNEVLETAVRDAHDRAPNAQLVRMYATHVLSSGVLGKNASVSVLFALFADGEPDTSSSSEGLRWELQHGRTKLTSTRFSPPASRPTRHAPLCDWTGLVRVPNAPREISVSARFAQQGRKSPSLDLFSTTLPGWIAVVDPATCRPLAISRPQTKQEESEHRAQEANRGHRVFDPAQARAVIRGGMKRWKSCAPGDHPQAPSVIHAVFDKRGVPTVVQVSGHGWKKRSAPQDCLPTLLRRLRIEPWDIGSGDVQVRMDGHDAQQKPTK